MPRYKTVSPHFCSRYPWRTPPPFVWRASLVWLALFAACLFSAPITRAAENSPAEPACGGNSTVDTQGAQFAEQSRDFLARLQMAVMANDKTEIAGMISYPLLVIHDGTRTRIGGRAAFLGAFNEIFDAPIRSAILDQSAACLFGNDRGAMVGSGEVWFSGAGRGGMKIITINPSASTLNSETQ